jgi:PleD family two-component response regulator
MVIPGKKIPSAPLPWLASLVLLPPYMRNTAKKILIADENDACRESLGVSIKGLGYEVFEAATGQEALDKASSIHPDLIMMDLRLPGMNGDEATVRLKEEHVNPKHTRGHKHRLDYRLQCWRPCRPCP